jgi:hypothetical protein
VRSPEDIDPAIDVIDGCQAPTATRTGGRRPPPVLGNLHATAVLISLQSKFASRMDAYKKEIRSECDGRFFDQLSRCLLSHM